MNRNLPVQATPAPRVVHYVQPAPQADLMLYSVAELATRRREQQLFYARWLARRAVQAEQDRKVRRFWLGFGAVVGTALLAAIAVLGWLAWHAVAGVGVGLLGVVAVVLLAALVGVGGHRCITTIQHWH